MTIFDDAFAYVIGEEGGLSVDPTDPGNWTSGRVNSGQLVGTKYGISAAQFPTEDILNMSLDRAKTLAKPRYWDPFKGDQLPPAVAFAMFDSSYNQGAGTAVRFLQTALRITVDGAVGPGTIAALQHIDLVDVLADFTTQRIMSYTKDSAWPTDGKGWVTRAIHTLVTAEMHL